MFISTRWCTLIRVAFLGNGNFGFGTGVAAPVVGCKPLKDMAKLAI